MAAKRVKSKTSPQRQLYLGNTKVRTAIVKRVRFLIKDEGGVTKFGRAHGITPKYLYRWYSNGMVPSTDYLIKLAYSGNISPDWVLLGKGKPYFTKAS